MVKKTMQSEPQKLLRDNYDSCQFWLGSEWYDLSLLQRSDSNYLGYEYGDQNNEIEFNFCEVFEENSQTDAKGNCPGSRYAFLLAKDQETEIF